MVRQPLAFLTEIQSQLGGLTPQQRVLADFLIAHPESLAFMSIVELAQKARVSEATVVRFCNKIGYEGYSALSSQVRHAVQQQFSSADRFKLGRLLDTYTQGEDGDNSIFTRVITSEMENLYNLTQAIRASDFRACVDRVLKADRVLAIGAWASTALAMHMHQMLAKVLPQVDAIHHREIAASAMLRRLTSRSVAFIITFPRYAKDSLDIAREARERDTFVVAVTDSHLSPAVELAQLSFFIPVDVPSFVDAYAAPVAFINALATEIGVRRPKRAHEALDYYDRLASKWKTFAQKDTEWRPSQPAENPRPGSRKPLSKGRIK